MKPSTIEQRVFFYSQYKSVYTIKYLIAINPNGFVAFLSKGYGGRSTDGFVNVDSQFTELLELDDVILADKGFPQIVCEIGKQNAVLIMPQFGNTNEPQFSEENMQKTFKVATVRVHVECTSQRIRLFNILHNIDLDVLGYADVLVHVCGVLVNFQTPILKQTLSVIAEIITANST